MPAIRHLTNPPIAEAIVDIGVKARSDVRVEAFQELRGRLKQLFPKVQEQQTARVEFRLPQGREGTGGAAFRQLGPRGLLFKSEDEKLVAQFRVDGFTLNRLQPYRSWEELFGMAQDLWDQYVSVAQPEAVTRLALRYINRIRLPAEVSDLSQWMSVPPQVPVGLPQQVAAFLYRITILDERRGLKAHIAQVLEASPGPTLLVDIDAFKETDASPMDPVVETAFGALHEFKNEIFFGMLTDEAIKSFE